MKGVPGSNADGARMVCNDRGCCLNMVAARTTFRALVELTTFDSCGIVSASTRQLFLRQRDIAIVSVRRQRQEARERDTIDLMPNRKTSIRGYPGRSLLLFHWRAITRTTATWVSLRGYVHEETTSIMARRIMLKLITPVIELITRRMASLSVVDD